MADTGDTTDTKHPEELNHFAGGDVRVDFVMGPLGVATLLLALVESRDFCITSLNLCPNCYQLLIDYLKLQLDKANALSQADIISLPTPTDRKRMN